MADVLDHRPSSPRGRALSVGACDDSAVYVDECEETGRFLRLRRSVLRGQAFLVEEPLFLSPTDGPELDALLAAVCDPAAIAAATSAASSPASPTAAAALPGTLATSLGQDAPAPAAQPWLPLPSQLTLAIVRKTLADPDCPSCEALRELRGDQARWEASADALWALLRQDIRELITREALCEVYAIVAMNAHMTNDGRAGLFHMGSFAEHSCTPNAFKEVMAVAEGSAVWAPSSPSTSPKIKQQVPPLSLAGPNGKPRLVLRAQSDMADGDRVQISYVPEYLPTWTRREMLQASYGFVCQCDRCKWEPEAVCAYVCPQCGEGPCTPSAPVLKAGELQGHSLLCEACGAKTLEDVHLEKYRDAELNEVISAESMQLLHPYHYKVYGMYMGGMKSMPPPSRIQACEQLTAAQCRLTKSDSHPLLGKFAELAAQAHLELDEHHEAAAGFKRAEDLFALSHRGLPDPGHGDRCFQQQTAAVAGPLGATPRRLSHVDSAVLARPPSMPKLVECEVEADEGAASPTAKR